MKDYTKGLDNNRFLMYIICVGERNKQTKGFQMFSKDLKKGDRVLLKNGWEATIKGSASGTTTLCEVYGYETEIGSVYTHDIEAHQVSGLCWVRDIELTKSQIKCQQMANAMGW